MEQTIFKRLMRLNPRAGSTFILYMASDIQPKRQQGPSCGLLALAVALSALSDTTGSNLDVDTFYRLIMDQAFRDGFTKLGEMFCARSLCDLVGELGISGVQAEMVEWTKHEQIAGWIRNGDLILVAYDKDGNHEPCFRNGNSAHWCLVVGGLGYRPTDPENNDTTNDNVLFRDDEVGVRLVRDTASTVTDKEPIPIILAFHGQSLHPAVWSTEQLFQSNQQLARVSDAVMERALSEDRYIVPGIGRLAMYVSGDLTQSLAKKVILLRRSSSVP